MEPHDKTEEELIGMLVKLKKRDSELDGRIENLLKYDGDFHKALEKKWGSDNDPERWFKATMSVDPNRIIKLAEALRALQEEYMKAHQELREFEGKYPSIAKSYG